MTTRHHITDYVDIKPSHEFDARFVINGRPSPLCGVKLWLLIDCHEDARIQVTGSDPASSPHPRSFDGTIGSQRMVSEIDPAWGFEVEADALHVRRVNTKLGQRVHGADIMIDDIGRLRFKRRLGKGAAAEADPCETLTTISFRLSDLNYGSPHTIPITDYRGNRKVKVLQFRTLKMRLASRVVKLELHRHWNWHQGKFDQLVAGSSPVLVVKQSQSLRWGQLEEIQQLGQDACLLLALAARHLAVVHVVVAATKERHLEEWMYPLNRQRSTTEEEATGPLIDENELEDYFSSVAVRWSALTDQQRDAVRQAIFSIHPAVESSIEGSFLRMFTALEGLAKTWFPDMRRIDKKIPALMTAFPPGVGGLWPIIDPNKDGLNAIRDHLAHGGSMGGQRMEALSVGIDHLQIWIEKILLAILAFPNKVSPQDWLSRHVQQQRSELPRLRAVVKA